MNRKIEIDLHTHTIYSGHATGTIPDNAKAAREAGLTGLGISDHAPGIPGVCDPSWFLRIREIPRQIEGIHIYYGVENNLLNGGKMALGDEYLGLLDYNMVGIHGTCYRDEGMERNTQNLIECMKHPKTFFVSHPDDGTWPLDYERLVAAAKELGVALELNNAHVASPWRKNSLENMKIYLALCLRYRAPIFLGSDAHEPGKVGRFDEAFSLLETIGFDEELIVNASEERFLKFTDLHK